MKNESTTTNGISTLHHLLDYDIQQFTGIENALNISLKKWIRTASDLKLKSILQQYHGIVQEHISQLQEVIQTEKLNWVTVGNRVIKALLQQTEEKIKQCRDLQISDACLLASIQQINHLKISWYGTAAEFSKELESEKMASLFHFFELNEKKIDHLLSRLAKKEINPKAIAPIFISKG